MGTTAKDEDVLVRTWGGLGRQADEAGAGRVPDARPSIQGVKRSLWSPKAKPGSGPPETT